MLWDSGISFRVRQNSLFQKAIKTDYRAFDKFDVQALYFDLKIKQKNILKLVKY